LKIDIKPLSVNDAWAGRRFKTKEYKQFEKDLLLLLPKKIKIPEGKIQINFIWGFSSTASDWDNPIKPVQDVICKKYKLNDNRVYFGTAEKTIVKKGKEFIQFEIIDYHEKTKENQGL